MASISPTSLSCPCENHTSKHGYVKLTITNISQTGGAENKTTVDYKITIEGTPWVYLYALYVSLGGEVLFEQYSKVKKSWSAGDVIKSGSVTFNNNTDGSLTLNAYIKQLFYYAYSDSRWNSSSYVQEGSTNMVCSTIPRYASIVKFDLAKRNETSVTFSWETSKTCDAVQYSVNGGSWTNGVYPTTTISGLSPNTSYSIKIRVKAEDSQLWTESTAKNITTYQAPTNSFNSKTETTVKINWSCDDTVDYIWYSKDNGANWTGLDVTDGTSGSYTISGLSANTSYNIKTRIRRKTPQTTYDCTAVSVTTYDYPYCTSSPNFTIGNAVKLDFYNPLDRSISVKLIGNGDKIIGSWTGTGTSVNGFNDTSTVNNQYASIPNATSSTYKVQVIYGSVTKTRNNGNTYSVDLSKCTPTFSNFTYKDINSVVTGITGNNQVLVKGLSTLQAIITSANKMIANKSATGKNYVLSIANLSKTVNYSTSDLTIDLGKVTSSGTQRLNVRAYDSRNNSTLAYKDITVYDYAKPVINASITRLNNFEAQTSIKVSGTYTKLTINSENKNTITKVQYRYRETGGTWSSWVAVSTTVSNGNFTCSDVILSLDNTKFFDFEIQAIDKLQQTTTKSVVVNIGQAIFFVSSNKKACYINGQEIIMYDVVDTW